MIWPKELIVDIARRQCVIFLGAGISRNSKNKAGRQPKTWEMFLSDALKEVKSPRKHIETLIKHNDYLTACEIIKRKLGRDGFIKKLKEEFLAPHYQKALIHEYVFKLDSRIVATPNFDKIYEIYAGAESSGSTIVKHPDDTDVIDHIRGDGRLILKIHGSIDSPDKMIFTRSEYAEARTKYAPFYHILSALSLTHTFLFLGCGVNDPDIKLLMEDVFFRYPHARKHIMVLPKDSIHNDISQIVSDTMNLNIIQYSHKKNHLELTTSLKRLIEEVEMARDDLRKTGNW